MSSALETLVLRRSPLFRFSVVFAIAAILLTVFVGRAGSVARTDTTGLYESLGVPLEGYTIPATNVWAEGRLLYALAVEGSTDTGPFMVYDIDAQSVIYTGNANIVTNHRMIMIDREGNAYFSVNGDGLAKYDPGTNSVSVLSVSFPSGGWLRASSRELDSGWIYGVSFAPEKIFRFNAGTQQLQELGNAWGYAAHVVVDPTERYMYYMPDAHGGAYSKGAPVLQYDIQTGNHKVIAFLNSVIEADYDYRIGGTYAFDINETGDTLYFNLNAVDRNRDPGAGSGFGDPVVVVVKIPSSEAPIVSVPSFSFTDVAEESGIDSALDDTYLHTSSWGDVNNDGWLDLFAGTFASGPTQSDSKLLLNEAGSFTESNQPALEITGRAAGSVFADLDNDGDSDLYISNNRISDGSGPQLETSRLLRNDNGNFVDVTAGSGINAQSSNGRQAGVLDYNGDGLLDLFVVADSLVNSGPTVLLRNDGGMQFTNVTSSVGLSSNAHGLGFAIGDMTGNGWPDIFIAGEVNQFNPNGNFLYVANGDGTYHEFTGNTFDWAPFTNGSEDWVSGASLADLNRDGRLDMVVGHHFGSSVDGGQATKVRVYMNRGTFPNGDPDFEDITNATGLPGIMSKAPHVEIQDFDNDGYPDIYVSVTVDTVNGPAPLIFEHNGNSGDPTFSLASNISSISNPNYYAGGPSADFNGDGKLDIFMAEWRSTLGSPVPSRLMQNTGAPGNWLQVKVEGDTGAGENAMGVGALVKVYKAGTSQLLGAREINPSFGWSSSQPAIAHFGLGNETRVDVLVEMPHSETFHIRTNVPVNRMLNMPDGATETPAHMGLERSAITISGDGRFLNGPGGLPSHTTASTPPVVEFIPFEYPNYAGNPWSTWGAGEYASNGRFYAGIGDHLKVDGNSFLYEYDPVTKVLKAVGDINTAVNHVQGAFGHGKIHSRIDEGGDGYIYMTSYRGSATGMVFDENFTGGALLRYPVGAASSVSGGGQSPPSSTPTPAATATPTPVPTATPTPGPQPTATPTSPPGSGPEIVNSASSDRSNPVQLNGLSVDGDIYVFIANDSNVDAVEFFVDDPSQQGAPWRTENDAPYDFAGSAGNALPYDTNQLSDGQHTISTVITYAGGGSEVLSATFTVNNSGGPLPTSTPEPSATPVPTATSIPPTATPQPTTPPATATPQPTATTPPSSGGGGGVVVAPPPPTATPSFASVAPDAPESVTATVEGTTVLLEIVPPFDDGGSPVTGYRVLSSPDGKVFFIDRLTMGDSIEITKLEPGVEYTFQVRAISSAGMGTSATTSRPVTIPSLVATATPVTSGAPSDPPTETPAPTASPSPLPATPTVVPTQPIPTATPTPVPSPTPTSTPVVSATAEFPPDAFTIELHMGWNLVSFQVLPENRSIENVLASIDGLYQEVSTIVNGQAVTYKPNRNENANSLDQFMPDRGYWIKMKSDATLVTVGEAIDRRTPIELSEGWNLVPYLIDEEWPVRLALASIAGQYDEVRGFDTEGRSFFPALPVDFNTLDDLEPGSAYLVHMTEPGVLIYP